MYFLYVNRNVFISLTLANLSFILLLGLNLENLKLFFIFLLILKQLRLESIDKPKSYSSPLGIYSYHSLVDLPILNYISVCFLILSAIILNTQSIELKLCGIAVLSFVSVFNTINVLIMVNFLNPLYTRVTGFVVATSALGSTIVLTGATLHVFATTPMFEVPQVFLIQWYQRKYFGFQIDQIGLTCRQIINLLGLQHPPILSNGFYDTETAKLIILRAGAGLPAPVIWASFMPQSLILPRVDVKVELSFQEREKLITELDAKIRLLDESRKAIVNVDSKPDEIESITELDPLSDVD